MVSHTAWMSIRIFVETRVCRQEILVRRVPPARKASMRQMPRARSAEGRRQTRVTARGRSASSGPPFGRAFQKPAFTGSASSTRSMS